MSAFTLFSWIFSFTFKKNESERKGMRVIIKKDGHFFNFFNYEQNINF